MKHLAKDIMSSDVFYTPEHADLNLVEVLADAQHIRHVPVVGKEGEIVGILSIRDILMHLSKAGASHFIPVGKLMTRKVVTAVPNTPLSQIAALMREHEIGSIPIVEDGVLIGIVTERDLLKVF